MPASPAADAGPTLHRARQRRALRIALALNGGFLVVEFAGGLLFDSLALLADAAHMLSDVAALSIALVAARLLERPPSDRHSFGLQRAEVLGAQANALILFGASAWIVVEAFGRIADPADVAGGGLTAVALVGLAVNLTSMWILARVPGRNLNLRGAMIHMAADAAGSLAAVGAGVAVVVAGADVADPVASVAISLLVVWAGWGLLADAAHVLMEGTPEGIDPAAVASAIEAVEGVDGVHHLHVWNLASDVPALSAHVLMDGDVTLHEGQRRAEAVKARLAEEFGIEHATLEIECHECPSPQGDDPGVRSVHGRAPGP